MVQTFRQALEAFNNAANSIDSRVTTLQKEVKQNQAEHTKAAERYRQAMIDDAAGTKEFTTAELTQLKRRVEELASDIATGNERLEMLTAGSEAGKKEKLLSLLDDVREARAHELVGLNTNIESIQEEAREIRAQLTIKILEANVHYKKAQELKRDLNSAERAAGLTFSEVENRLGIPTSPRTSQPFEGAIGSYIGDLCVLPREDELEKAYTHGELPTWITHYAENGELLTDAGVRQLHVTKSQNKEKGVIGRLFKR